MITIIIRASVLVTHFVFLMMYYSQFWFVLMYVWLKVKKSNVFWIRTEKRKKIENIWKFCTSTCNDFNLYVSLYWEVKSRPPKFCLWFFFFPGDWYKYFDQKIKVFLFACLCCCLYMYKYCTIPFISLFVFRESFFLSSWRTWNTALNKKKTFPISFRFIF